MTNHLAGRTIIITGAASGFGRLVAQKTAALGAKVVAADLEASALELTVGPIVAAGHDAIAVRADVTARDEMRALAAATVERFGRIDVLVNNAGVMPLAFYSDHEQAADAWDRCIDVNIKGVVNGISAVHDQMMAQGRGHIVNISSTYGNYPVSGAAVYGATKAAVNVLSDALRQESQGRIKVTTIRPTGVPGTGLGAGIINRKALGGILGSRAEDYRDAYRALGGDDPPVELADPDSIGYLAPSPDELADQIVYAIDQPWGISISDLTVRASGEHFVL